MVVWLPRRVESSSGSPSLAEGSLGHASGMSPHLTWRRPVLKSENICIRVGGLSGSKSHARCHSAKRFRNASGGRTLNHNYI